MTLRARLDLAFALLSVLALLTSGIITQSQTAFADDDKKEKKPKTLESECAKKKGNNFDGLLCRAVLGLQNQIDSFFDIFVELADVANFGCPQGQVAIGTNADGGLICGPDPGNNALDQRLDDLEARIIALEEDQPTCPNNCSSHGTCSNGQCVCDSGFTGSDCSIPQGGQCTPGNTQSCYSGPAETLGVGQCTAGTQTCNQNSQFGACVGDVTPSNEVCDGLDNDCNGLVDDNCS